MPRTDESPVIALCWGTLIGTPLEPLIEAAGGARARRDHADGRACTRPAARGG